MLKPGRTYTLYGFRYWLQTVSEFSSNSRVLGLLFGDSSAIVHYIRAIGWNLNKVVQTGSNFGSNQQHENPLLCEIGTETDGVGRTVHDQHAQVRHGLQAGADPRLASATISATTSTIRRMDAPATTSCSAPR